MKNFDKFALATAAAKDVKTLNRIALEVIQDRTLISLELYHLGRIAGIQLCKVNPSRVPSRGSASATKGTKS